jgi:hypothetical protein
MHLTAFGAVQVSNLFIKVIFPPINFQPQFANSLYIFQVKEQVDPARALHRRAWRELKREVRKGIIKSSFTVRNIAI